MNIHNIPCWTLCALLLSGAGVCEAQTVITPEGVTVAGQELPAPSQEQPSREQQSQAQIQGARDRVMPYVVSILVVSERFDSGEARRQVSSGSGTVITPQGHVLTNAHVTNQGASFRVVMMDGSEHRAVMVGEDPISDLAVLKVELKNGERIGHVPLRKDILVQTGDGVLAMGAPWGLSQSMSQGVVNNPKRLLASLFQDEADYEASLGPDQPTARYYAWIQHDAPISPGNSGGPLVNLAGEIVGVNTRGQAFGGDMAFAIPGVDAANIAEKLIAHGQVPRAYFGFRLRSLKNTGHQNGVLINSVLDQSPAAKAGLQAGDRILSINGKTLDVRLPEDVPPVQRQLAEMPVDQVVILNVENGGKPRAIKVTPVAMPKDRGDDGEIEMLGLTAVELTPAMALRRKIDGAKGLLIQGVRAGGAAAIAKPALMSNDVLRSLDGQSLDEFSNIRQLKLNAGKPVVAEFERNGERLVSLLTPQDPDKRNTPQNELSKPWAGVDVQAITPSVATELGMPSSGFRVTRVYADGPLAQEKIQVGDLIIAIEGAPLKAINETDTTPFSRRVRDGLIGEALAMTVWRKGKQIEMKPKLVAAPLAENAMPSVLVSQLGVRVRELSFFDRRKRKLQDEQRGVLVEQVESGHLGGLAHLDERDIVLQVNGRAIQGIEQFRQSIATALADANATPNLLVLRNNETRLLFIDRAWMEQTP